MKIDLSGKISLVTGATGDIGRSVVLTLAECGSDIIVHYNKNKEKALKLCKEINSLGRKAVAVSGDISNFSEILKMKEEIRKNFSFPDIIVTCAVTNIYPWKMILEEEPEKYIDQFNSCVLQNVYIAKAFVPEMIKKGYGRYIGINTEVSMRLDSYQSAYASGKRAMDGVLRILAKEVGEHNITVNQVAPGWVIGERDIKAGTEKQVEYEENIPLKRRGTVQEVSNVIAFLASDLASFITGSFIPVSGGSIMPGI